MTQEAREQLEDAYEFLNSAYNALTANDPTVIEFSDDVTDLMWRIQRALKA